MFPDDTNKPLTEKRRRDRINKCILQLKNIILKATGKEEKKFAKLEKAEILDMTIQHLMNIHKDGKVITANPAEGVTDDYNLDAISINRCLRRVDGVDNLMPHLKTSTPRSSYLYPPVTPRYNCGYSGSKAIMDVNFGNDDVLDREGLMCGSVSRVFVYGEEEDMTSQCGSYNMKNASEKFNISPGYGSNIDDFSEIPRHLGTEEYRTTSTPIISSVTSSSGPKYTSTPVSSCRSKPYRTSTPVSRDFLSPPQQQFTRDCYNLRISPDLRMQLFTHSQHSSDSDSAKDSTSKSCDSSNSSGELHWRPW